MSRGIVDHFETFKKSSLLLKTANFSNTPRLAISLSRKILREIYKELHNLKMRSVLSTREEEPYQKTS